MIDLDRLREARYREPFKPFSLCLSDGREIAVRKWESIGISPHVVVVVGPGWAFHRIRPDLIEDIRYPTKRRRRNRPK